MLKPVNIVFMSAGLGFSITGDMPQAKAGNKPFGGEHFNARLNIDNIDTFVGCLVGVTNNLDGIDFSPGGDSHFTIAP